MRISEGSSQRGLPEFIKTPLTLGPIPEGPVWNELAAKHSFNRCAEPAEVAAIVAFLGIG